MYSYLGIYLFSYLGIYTLRATLVNALGDTLAVHELYGLLGPSANYFCRSCMITRRDLHNGNFGDNFPHRTVQSVQIDLETIQQNEKLISQCGIKEECVLHELGYFRWPNNHVFDPMHDLFEGILPMIIKKMLTYFVNDAKLITVGQVNNMIDEFDYGETEIRDKPSSNFTIKSLKAKGNTISQSAAQCWLLIRSFPFIFHEVLKHRADYANIIGLLLKICFICFSSKLSQETIADLEKAIFEFHTLFKQCFSECKAINKIHHIAHYPQVCRENGPIYFYSCMQYESKFKESKSQAKTCGNFRNLTLSLTKRLALKQALKIINHKYDINKITIISTSTTEKTIIDTSGLLFDMPDEINIISQFKINSIEFRPGFVVKYENLNECFYGILLYAVNFDNKISCIVQELEMQDLNSNMLAYKVIVTKTILRISIEKLFTRKVYSLWQLHKETNDNYFISLKYDDE